MLKEAEFRDWYLRLSDPDKANRHHAATGSLNQLCAVVFVHHDDWGNLAPKLVPFTMEGVTYDAIDTTLLVDTDQIPYLKPYDKLEFFLLRLPGTDQGAIAYKMVYKGRTSADWLDLRRVPTSTLENIFGHILTKCPPSYESAHVNLNREVQKYAAAHYANRP